MTPSFKSIPRVSMLLPVYNAEKYVGIAIESILDQTFNDFELIILDDRSSDGSAKIVEEYASKDPRIRLIRTEHNLGGCHASNKCLALAAGQYIGRIDNDDWAYPDRLAKQVAFLDAHPEVGIVGGVLEIMDENGRVTGRRKYRLSDPEIRAGIFKCSPFAHPLIMMRKSVLDVVGGYDPVYAPADDYDLYFRIGARSQFANLPDVLLRYRVVPGSITDSNTRKMEMKTIRVRNRYANGPGYKMTVIDHLYNFLHYISLFFMPVKLKVRLFNLVRNSK